MQINITQYVLVRIPRNMGLFKPKSASGLIGDAMQAKLMSQINENDDEFTRPTAETEDGESNQPKMSLGRLLQQLKDARSQGDDNFRA